MAPQPYCLCFCRFHFRHFYQVPSAFSASVHVKGYQHMPETHYQVLGIHKQVSQEQVKAAYLGLSKELHPDLNHREDEKDMEEIHQKFVKVNNAYSVLGNKKERRVYDLHMGIQKEQNMIAETGSVHTFRTKHMNFDERSRSMGFKSQDPNFYNSHGNYHQNVGMWCAVVVVVGLLLQSLGVMMLLKQNSSTRDQSTAADNEIIMTSWPNAMRYTKLGEQRRGR